MRCPSYRTSTWQEGHEWIHTMHARTHTHKEASLSIEGMFTIPSFPTFIFILLSALRKVVYENVGKSCEALLTEFYVLLTVHPGMILVNNQLDAQLFVYAYFYSLCVSGSHMPIIRRIIVSMRHLAYVTVCR